MLTLWKHQQQGPKNWIGAAIAAGASLIGNKMSQSGQEDTNVANARQAELNRDFQERMSNTSYQRAVKDLKLSGLNPMLAYSQGGASTPSGSTAQMNNPKLGWSNAGQQAAMAFSAEQAQNQSDQIKAQTDFTKAQTASELLKPELVAAQTRQTLASAGQLEAFTDQTRQNMKKFEAEYRKLVFEMQKAGLERDMSLLERQKFERTFEDQVQAIKARAQQLTFDARVAGLTIPGYINDAAFESSPAGKMSRFTRYGLETAEDIKDVVTPKFAPPTRRQNETVTSSTTRSKGGSHTTTRKEYD